MVFNTFKELPEKQQQAKKLMALLDYIERAPRQREVIDFGSQVDADKAGHEIRRLGGERVRVSIGASRVIVSIS